MVYFSSEKGLKMDSYLERRIFERIDGILTVKYTKEGQKKEYYSVTKNISGGGIKIELPEQLKLGTILDLHIFKINSDISTTCKGSIIWTVKASIRRSGEDFFEAGVKFLNANFLYIGSLIYDLETRSSSRNLLSALPY